MAEMDGTRTVEAGFRLRQVGPRVVEVYGLDGVMVGRVLRLSSTWRGSRRAGTEDDIRRVGDGFRSVESAARWVAKCSVAVR